MATHPPHSATCLSDQPSKADNRKPSEPVRRKPSRLPAGSAGTQGQPGVSHKFPKLDYDPAEYQLVRHLPRHCARGPGEVYITLKTAFKAQMDRCRKMLETPGCKEITLHGMGAATNRAVNLALQLQNHFEGLLELWTTTGSVEMTDELEPLRDDLDPVSQSRFVSVIRIRVFFVKTLEELKQ